MNSSSSSCCFKKPPRSPPPPPSPCSSRLLRAVYRPPPCLAAVSDASLLPRGNELSETPHSRSEVTLKPGGAELQQR
ncbi:hypothetical protein JOB18_021997 [Solea senegalensis]|uniref:Uncharacterized protein n=1 Tax=Solea senegalensis TaxID=28829 RepID=A0AAV6SDN5_SOLSE|nr:hypothetical protein JOB18_021997 [Solea senegalensis]